MSLSQIKIKDKLELLYISDLSKPEINKFERAELLFEFMKKNKFSLSEFCRRYKFKKGTVSGWMKWRKLGRVHYKELRRDGYSESDITKMLKREDTSKEGQLVVLIRSLKDFLGDNPRQFNIKDDTIEELKDLINTLNTLLFRNGK